MGVCSCTRGKIERCRCTERCRAQWAPFNPLAEIPQERLNSPGPSHWVSRRNLVFYVKLEAERYLIAHQKKTTTVCLGPSSTWCKGGRVRQLVFLLIVVFWPPGRLRFTSLVFLERSDGEGKEKGPHSSSAPCQAELLQPPPSPTSKAPKPRACWGG